MTRKERILQEIERRHFARAARLGESFGFPEEEVRSHRVEALWQMSAANRNAYGTRRLADAYGFGKEEVRAILETRAEERRAEGKGRDQEPCYDHATGKYLSFAEWLDQFLKHWDKLASS
jgi:hypothetical protein